MENIDKKKVFISYVREDKEIAKKLYYDLKKINIEPWLDIENILVGQNWRSTIRQAIKESSYFIALLSLNSITKRGYVQKELKIASDILDEFPNNTIFIIPVCIDDCKPIDEKLEKLQWVDLFHSYEEGLKKIKSVILPDDDEKNDSIIEKRKAYKDYSSIDENTELSKEVNKRIYFLRDEPKSITIYEFKKEFNLESFLFIKRLKYYVKNDYEDNNNGTITDHATALMWQQSGSLKQLNIQEAYNYIDNLNNGSFAGFSDWRLPTMDELFSLREINKQTNGLYIHNKFDINQTFCWSSDKRIPGSNWLMYFTLIDRFLYSRLMGDINYIRSVRSII